ncbi:unnamed protein product [Darwinula stevensoni]|uniref:Uncharacterized protein n=1 Tax=Darwinula stevensoni TaxID=69355 RepID=A0A7R8X7B0_9CRUS|nr:unnamed protein product [Darwinula stevensoni]CAG0886681.1 unnamed protein product [Darwinula stevensoni]
MQLVDEKAALEKRMEEMSEALAREKELKTKHEARIEELEKQLEKDETARQDKERNEDMIEDEFEEGRAHVEEMHGKLENLLKALAEEKEKAKDLEETLAKEKGMEAKYRAGNKEFHRVFGGNLSMHEEIQRIKRTITRKMKESKVQVEEMQRQFARGKVELAQAHAKWAETAFRAHKPMQPQMLDSPPTQIPRCQVENESDLLACLHRKDLHVIHVYSHSRVKVKAREPSAVTSLDLDADWTVRLFRLERKFGGDNANLATALHNNCY